MKENMVRMINCNYYRNYAIIIFSSAKKFSSAFPKLFQFFFLVISCFNFTSWWFHSAFNYVFLLLSPSFQYCSVCISVSRERVRWKAKISSSPVNMESPLAESYINTQKQYHRPVRHIGCTSVQPTPKAQCFTGFDKTRQQHGTKKLKLMSKN